MQKKRRVFACGILCAAVAAGIGMYKFSQPRQSLAGVTPAYSTDAASLYSAYTLNGLHADSLYLDRVLEISGIVEGTIMTDSSATILLATGSPAGNINCNLYAVKGIPPPQVPGKGNHITVKGRCTGFLEDVNVVDAVIVSN